MPTPLSMEIYRGDELLETREFSRDIIKIGRLASAHLRLDDEKVSRIHSVVEVGANGEVSIIDMGSAEGTLVNGERINKGSLKDGDEIRVGDTRIIVHVQAGAASSNETTQEIKAIPPAPGTGGPEAAGQGEAAPPGDPSEAWHAASPGEGLASTPPPPPPEAL
ncbi:MAG: FHA domain-containing protein, partial [Deltaproteobacteria bacterium]